MIIPAIKFIITGIRGNRSETSVALAEAGLLAPTKTLCGQFIKSDKETRLSAASVRIILGDSRARTIVILPSAILLMLALR